MGCCISKCSRKRKRQDQQSPNLVEDKLVITQGPISPIPFSSTKQPLSRPQSPGSTSSAISSFSCTNSNPSTTSYSFTSSSSSSSCSISKERSFSNEFLKSCIKENPHIVHNHVKTNLCSAPNKNKRARVSTKSSNFAHARQKSFRREIERQSFPHSLPRNPPRSPSPSRRFLSTPTENLCKPPMSDKSIATNPSISLAKKENLRLRPLSPGHNLAGVGPYLTTRERCTHRIGSKIEELVKVDEVLLACKQDHDGGNTPLEDIDNPLIALDCFIFL